MRDDDGGDPQAPVDVLDERKDGFRSGGVEGGSGLVAQEDLGVGSQSAGDGDALLLPARKLRRVGLCPVGQVDQLKQLARPLAGGVLFDSGKLQRKADVFLSRALHEEVELLEDHAHAAAGDLQIPGTQTAHVLAFEHDASAGRPLKHVDAAYQRAFPGAAFADDPENIPFPYGQVDALEGIDFGIFGPEPLFEVLDLNDGFRHPRFSPVPFTSGATIVACAHAVKRPCARYYYLLLAL